MSEDGESKPAKRRRGPRKATASYLENSAAHYLGRFATSSTHLRQLMMQKVKRSVAHHGTDADEGAGFVDAIIAKFERLGFLNDQAYAEMRARSLHAKGTPVRGIRYKLQQKGLSEDNIDAGLAALAAEVEVRDLDLSAALRLARRRRLGPYLSEDKDVREARRDKDMAVLARAGFSYDVVCQVLDADSAEELELAAASD
ncbi:RecX family transcriptional regulator [Thalassospiraceae bacterium LMO-JJ14]|nr:RecX family transcriptional regulator [Thalassospiraceae bacterium LMO-JJ14]